MDALTFDASEATPLILKTRSPDGSISEHHFEILSLTKPVIDSMAPHEKKMMQIQGRTKNAPGDQLEMFNAMAASLSTMLKSTNGPVTITSLWDDGLIGVEKLIELYGKLMENIRPPA